MSLNDELISRINALMNQDTAKYKLIVILGATATGKSALALQLAEQLDTEIISADSMMVYKRFNIGTAKPSEAELAKVKHHLVDILEPYEKYSVADFQVAAAKIIADMNRRNKIPIVAGGTGLYIQALVEGYKFNTTDNIDTDGKINKSVRSFFNESGELVYDAEVIGLTMERQMLYNRINLRTQKMFDDGLVDEVQMLLKSGVDRNVQAMSGIGYKETIEYLDGNLTLDETIAKISQATRNFAKRQFTWYRRMHYINWYDVGSS